jgi:hypothetical protein
LLAALAWASPGAQTPAPPPATTAAAPSTGVARVKATYDQLMDELPTVVAGGGQPTPRMVTLESQLAQDVAAAGSDLLAALATADQQTADAAAYALRYAKDADAAAAALVAALDRFDGGLSNNVGLALTYLAGQHPALQVPLSRLVPHLRAHTWNHQQKIAQLIAVLVKRGGVTDADGSLTAALIPMLASQRMRVFAPAREILPAITGQSLGTDAGPWIAWYAMRYGRPIDLQPEIYELVQIVRPSIENGATVYRVEGDAYSSIDALASRLTADAATARGLRRSFGLVLQLPTGFPPDAGVTLARPLVERVRPDDTVVSPMTDEFVPFSVALARLRAPLPR